MTINPPHPPMETVPSAPPASGNRQDLLRQGMKRLQLTLMPYGVAIGVLSVSAALGLAEWWQVVLVAALTAAGVTTFYLLLRSGVATRFADPMLTFPQVLFSIAMVSLEYALMDIARGFALEWLCLIIVFDIRRLSKMQTLVAAILAMTLPALGIYLAWLQQPGAIDLKQQLIFLMMGAVLVPVLLLVSAGARMVSWRGKKQKEEMAQALAQLRQLFIHDSLTGLHNRSHMQALLEEELQRHQRTSRPFCVAILDIDFFKQINDQLGHAAGDDVLRQFAALGRRALARKADSLARWGGEEFLLLMPETTQDRAHAALTRMRALVIGHDWTRQHPQLQVDFSAGVCEHRAGQSLAQTLEAADQALYRAKGQGRGRVETATPLSAAEMEASVKAIAATELATTSLTDDETPEVLAESAPAPESSASLPAPPTARPRPEPKWKTWLLGSDPAVHDLLPMCLVTAVFYFFNILLTLLYGIPFGIYSPEAATFILPMNFVGAIVPYALVRGGFTANLKDRVLAVPQMIWALISLVFCYVFVPDIRGYVLALMCVVQVFGFVNLKPGQATAVGLSVVLMLLPAYFVLLATRPPQFDPVHEGVTVAVTVFLFTLLTVLSRSFALKRDQVRQERRELLATIEQISQLMRRDTLTGLYNRQYMQSLLERECERQDRSGFGLCVAMIDLDHFKNINDTLGHQVGDEALAGFAHAAQESLRKLDVIGRWGGEEFLVLLVDTEPGWQGSLAVERLREHLASQRISLGAPELRLTFSAGLALRKTGETTAQVLERADRALYAAKAQGRNRSVQAES